MVCLGQRACVVLVLLVQLPKKLCCRSLQALGLTCWQLVLIIFCLVATSFGSQVRQHSLTQLLRYSQDLNSVVELALLLHLVTIEGEIFVLSKSRLLDAKSEEQ